MYNPLGEKLLSYAVISNVSQLTQAMYLDSEKDTIDFFFFNSKNLEIFV